MQGLGAGRPGLIGLGGLRGLDKLPAPRMGLLDAQKLAGGTVTHIFSSSFGNPGATGNMAITGAAEGDLFLLDTAWPSAGGAPFTRTGYTILFDASWTLGNMSSLLMYKLISAAEAAAGVIGAAGMTGTANQQAVGWGVYRGASKAVLRNQVIDQNPVTDNLTLPGFSPDPRARMLVLSNPSRNANASRLPPLGWTQRFNRDAAGFDSVGRADINRDNYNGGSMTYTGQDGINEHMLFVTELQVP